MYFAGEATDTDYWFATTVGAYSTGIKASNMIAESGVLSDSSSKLQPTCTRLNAACSDAASGLPCCNGTVCAKDGILGGNNKVCLLSTVVIPRPGQSEDSSTPADGPTLESFGNQSASFITSFSEPTLIGLAAMLVFVMAMRS